MKSKIVTILLLLSVLGVIDGQEDPFSSRTQENSNTKASASVSDVYGNAYCDVSKGLLNGTVLRQAGEVSLYNKKLRFSIRVTVSPTFGKPIILRLYEQDGEFFVSLRRLSGRGGYELGHVELFGEISVSENGYKDMAVRANQESISGLSKMTVKQRLDTRVMDGACWTMEIISNNEYKVIDLFSPTPLSQDATGIHPNLTKKAMNDFLDLAHRLFQLAEISDKNYFEK
jgi:hypothetical protein